MSRHYWPEPPKESGIVYRVEHQSGEMRLMLLGSSGSWLCVGLFSDATTDSLVQNGYLGVRTPLSEEADLKEFYKVFPKVTDPHDQYGMAQQEFRKEGWFARARHERGL